MFFSLMLTALVCTLLDDGRPDGWLPVWAIVSAAVSIVRFCLAGWQRRNAEVRPQVVLRSAVAGAIVGAFAWGALPWMIGPTDIGDQRLSFTVMALCGIAGGSLATSYGYAMIPIVFTGIMGLSVLGIVVRTPDPDHYRFIACIVVFVLILSRAAVRAQATFLRLVRLAEEQRELTASLEAASETVQATNRALAHLVDHDVLTGHLNRGGFLKALTGRLDAAAPGDRLAVMLLDLDGFKALNDSFGHPAGDAALAEVGRRLAKAVDGLDVDVARMGGDEFAVLLPIAAADGAPDPEAVAARIIAAVARPYAIQGERARLGCSLGIAVHPDDGGDMRSLVSHADMALYAAKDRGRGRAARFDVDLLSEANTRRLIEDELCAAIVDHQVTVFFQPQVSLADGRLVGVEAVLRWNHHLLGAIEPNLIVGTARRMGLRTALARLVIEETVALRERLGLPARGVRTAINISPLDLPNFSLSDLLGAATAHCPHGPAGFAVEITEEAELDIAECGPELARLRSIGVALSLDNFGVGRSTFAILEGVQVDAIKIDRRFSRDDGGEPAGRPTIESLLALGRALGVDVIAKGVETTRVAARLAELGCGTAQGVFLAPPMPADAFAIWDADRRGEVRFLRGAA